MNRTLEKTNKVIPAFIPKPYVAGDAIRILNTKQAAAYWAYGVQPVDIYSSKNYKTGEPCIVYVFRRSEQLEAYDAWVKGKEQGHEMQTYRD